MDWIRIHFIKLDTNSDPNLDIFRLFLPQKLKTLFSRNNITVPFISLKNESFIAYFLPNRPDVCDSQKYVDWT